LFSCNFEQQVETKQCQVRSGGIKWSKELNYYNGFPNQYYSTELEARDKTEMFFENLIEPPVSGVACLDFRYKKFSTGDSVPLTVLAWPYKGKPGKVRILRDSPDPNTWIRAQVTYRNINNYFLVMLKSSGPQNLLARILLAIDDVTITEGSCKKQTR